MPAWINNDTAYVPLWCKSAYSFLEVASHPDELVDEAHRLGLRALALTDRDGVYGMVRAHKRAREIGLQLVVAAELTLDDDSALLLYAMNRAGYANLCQLISAGRLRSPKGISRVTIDEVCARAPGHTRDACYARTGAYLRFQRTDEPAVAAACARAGEPFAAACRRGAALP